MYKNMSQKVLNIAFTCAIALLWVNMYHLKNSIKNLKPPETEIEYTVNDGKPNFYNKSPQEGLMEALEYYNVKHPKIVQAQAILETGNFTSKGCLSDNNLFGLYNSKKKKYYSFDHWANSVEAYVRKVQYKYKGDNDKPPNHYYEFLQDIGYAKDPYYINKIKEIVKQNDKRRSK